MATTKVEPKPVKAPAASRGPEKTYEGLTGKQLLQLYRMMFLSRRLDDREILLKRQQKIFFQISGAGHEALGVAAGLVLKSGYDWFYPYYRDRALCLSLGVTPLDMLLQAVGSAEDRASGGRQMPSHWADPALHVVTGSSPTGSQLLQAAGCAEAGRFYAAHPEAAKDASGDYRQFKHAVFHGDEITYVSCGEGATSEGEFWETMNTASTRKLPLLVCVEDNEYAISVPIEVQTAGGNISRLVASFPNFHFAEFDGTDPLASYVAFCKAAEHIRAGNGPAFVHGHVVRPYSHSLSDDERLYRPEAERREEARRDPITRLQMFLVREGILDEQGITRLEKQVEAEVQEASDRAVAAAKPEPESAMRFIYSPDLDPASAAFSSDPVFPNPKNQAQPTIAAATAQKTMADLINACLHDEMKRDPRIVVFGEDVADCSREE